MTTILTHFYRTRKHYFVVLCDSIERVNRHRPFVVYSDVVLEDRPWPRGSSRTQIFVLGLASRVQGLGLGLVGPGFPSSLAFGFWPL